MFFSATTTIGTVRTRNTAKTHAMIPNRDPQHHLASVFSSADRSRGRGGSLLLFVVGSREAKFSPLLVRVCMGIGPEGPTYVGGFPAIVVS
jgi:hypothetical protein